LIKKKMLFFISFMFLISLNLLLNHQLSSMKHTQQAPLTNLSSKVLKTCNMGYSNLIATYLWFQTVAYYGTNDIKIDHIYLTSILHNITILNPKFQPTYYMAALVLPWDTQSTTLSRPFVMQAMLEFPKEWTWSYYRGFNAYWFEHNSELAAHFFEISARKPNAPPLVTSLALRMHSHAGNIQTGLNFLKVLLQKKNDPKLQKKLLTQYQQLQTEQQLRAIERFLEKIPQRHFDTSDLTRLHQMGYKLPNKLADGGRIQVLKDGSLLSSKTKKRFKLFIPKKHQGIPSHATH